jgi:hypothetical protein
MLILQHQEETSNEWTAGVFGEPQAARAIDYKKIP